jgi:hypothetical protein
MQVTAWNNGGAGYGLEIRASDRDRFFDRHWRAVVLELSGQGQAVVAVSPSFWRRCSELRSAEIGRWLQRNGLAPWPRGRRPKVIMEHVTGNRFAVKLPG